MRDRLPHERADHLPPLTDEDIAALGVSLFPDDGSMHTSLDLLRAARVPRWQSALAAVSKWWARVRARLQPVPEGTCPGCETEKAKAHRWQGVADAWAEKCRAAELRESVLAAKFEATRERELCVPNEIDIAVAYDRPLPEQVSRMETSASARQPWEAIPSSVEASDARREGYAIARLAPRSGRITVPVVGEEEKPEPQQKPRPLPPIMRSATSRRHEIETGVPAEESAMFRGPGCTRKDGKPAITTAEIMARVKGPTSADIAARAAGGVE